MKVAALVVVGLLIAAGLAWTGSELHYRGCVEAAESSHPLGAASGLGEYQRFRGEDGKRRRQAVDGCSHLPW